jgi:hypothetical protein
MASTDHPWLARLPLILLSVTLLTLLGMAIAYIPPNL